MLASLAGLASLARSLVILLIKKVYRLTGKTRRDEITMNSGTYCLVLRLDEPQSIQVGKLGLGIFPKGYYVYVGSALNGLQKRIARHLSPQKKKYWHIDYLLEYAGMIGTRQIRSIENRECALSEAVGSICHGIPMEGFGSSDCRCTTHLYFFSDNPLLILRFESIWILNIP